MRRDCPVWIEAYQQYLLSYGMNCFPFDTPSDDEISEIFSQYNEYCGEWM